MRRLCFSVTRSLVIIINLIVSVLASLFIYISFTAFDQNYELDSLSESNPRLIHTYVSVICAGLGLIVVLLSVLGLYGAVRNSKSLLGTYAAITFFMVSILLVVVALSFTMGASSLSYKEVDKSYVNSTVVVYNYLDTGDMKTRIIDNIQRSFACCGVNSPNDWIETDPQRKMPRSCCSEPVLSSLPVFKYCSDSDYKVGCWKALTDHFHANLGAFRTILYFFIGFGLSCTLAACFMIVTLRRSLDIV